ncbi:MAG: VTT domain-containing protein [Vicinamibacterales bacterium]
MHDFLQGIVNVIQPFAERLGGPGLALIAFLDSSFLSLPEVADLLIVVLVIQHPARWLYYATMTTIGSVAGCYILYALARKGGEELIRKRFHAARVDRALGIFRRYGTLAIIVPSILPPPTPFKVFVLLAGVADMRPARFITAMAIGRGIRYGGEALLAYYYGEAASDFIREHGAEVGQWLAVAIIVGTAAWFLWRRRATA